MFRPILFASLLLVPVAGVHVGTNIGAPPPQCANTIVHEPIVLFESTGGTLVGPYDLELVVYGDGHVRISSSVQAKAQTAEIDPIVANGFAGQLERAGAFRLCDRPLMATDMPLSTLTILRADTDAAAHTFSWWAPDESNVAVDAAVHAFIDQVFPRF
jgi:hypothetical protein